MEKIIENKTKYRKLSILIGVCYVIDSKIVLINFVIINKLTHLKITLNKTYHFQK